MQRKFWFHQTARLWFLCNFLGDKYINGEIVPCKYPTYQPKQRKESKSVNKRYVRRKDGPPAGQFRPNQSASQSETSSWRGTFDSSFFVKYSCPNMNILVLDIYSHLTLTLESVKHFSMLLLVMLGLKVSFSPSNFLFCRQFMNGYWTGQSRYQRQYACFGKSLLEGY